MVYIRIPENTLVSLEKGAYAIFQHVICILHFSLLGIASNMFLCMFKVYFYCLSTWFFEHLNWLW